MQFGFSTGALAKGDFSLALEMLAEHPVDGVEVSALRLSELPELIECFPRLDLVRFEGRISLHAPSQFSAAQEASVATALETLAPLVQGIVVHAEAIKDPAAWRPLGSKVLVENADGRKHIGRTTEEMVGILEQLPEARVCFDLGHVYQVDSTLLEANQMLEAFGDRIGQLHLSQLDHACRHRPMLLSFVGEMQRVTPRIPDTMVILETPVPEPEIAGQLRLAEQCFLA